MSRDTKITDVRITPIAFRDGPLLNAAGIHEPWALRSIVEFETSDGRVGISETYGDEPMLRVLEQAKPLVLGLSPFDLNRMEERVRATIRPNPGAVEFELAPGSHTAKNAAKVTSTFEVAIALYGFQSIKLKGGVFEPAHEIACMRALHEAFPGVPLRLDPNANWSLETSIQAAPELDELLEYHEDPMPGLQGMAELARHHYWGGLRVPQTLARMCALWDLGMSMHSNSHLGISLMAMTHVAASIPNLTYACDTHYP